MWKKPLFGLSIGLLGLVLFGSVKPANNNTFESPAAAEKVSISVYPEKIIQGDPVLIAVNGTSSIKSFKFNGKEVPVFESLGKPSALIGIDLRGRIGTYPIEVELRGGRIIKATMFVGERKIAKAPLGIPEKLGGNTPQAERKLITTLAKEGAIINVIPASKEKLWSGNFKFPINGEVVITSVYGYSRLTGASTISHKGTDFRAATGTPVYAINSGVVRFTRNLRNYGNTIAIDHGTGILSFYMHLLEITVKEGQEVKKGEFIGRSGDTGYVLGPHLHLTIRINGVSIDPMKFVALLGEVY